MKSVNLACTGVKCLRDPSCLRYQALNCWVQLHLLLNGMNPPSVNTLAEVTSVVCGLCDERSELNTNKSLPSTAHSFHRKHTHINKWHPYRYLHCSNSGNSFKLQTRGMSLTSEALSGSVKVGNISQDLTEAQQHIVPYRHQGIILKSAQSFFSLITTDVLSPESYKFFQCQVIWFCFSTLLLSLLLMGWEHHWPPSIL